MNTEQRRQPVSYAELEEVRRTGVFPLMRDPVKAGVKPFCYNCTHWTPLNDHSGVCGNKDARATAPFARLDFGGKPLRYVTGALCDCPLHHKPEQ